ncbi:MAG: hypothetical protein ACK2TU_00985 [Anaerolineales bacterium]
MDQYQGLSPEKKQIFYILLSLFPGPKHDYTILESVVDLRDNQVLLSTCTLWRSQTNA